MAVKSASSSPLAKVTEGPGTSTSYAISSSASHSHVARPPSIGERSTDHQETHIVSPAPTRQQQQPVSLSSQTRQQQQQQQRHRRQQLQRQETQHEAKAGDASPGTRLRETEPSSPLRLPTAVISLADVLEASSKPKTPTSPESSETREAQKREQKSVMELLSSTSVEEFPQKRIMSYDSEPIHRELEALKKARGKVGKRSPTLKDTRSQDPAPVPSPGLGPGRQGSTPETSDQSIPKQLMRLGKPRPQRAAALMDDNISPPAQSVIECTDLPNQSDQTQTTTAKATSGPEGTDTVVPSTAQAASPTSSVPLSTLPPISDQTRTGSRSPRSPVSKHKLLRRQQKDERDTKLKEYSAISPKGSPVAARGKPPLPRQNTPVRHSPSSSPSISDKGTRSKSHGDVDSMSPPSPTIKPLQEAINKFEKRATVCETEDRPIELRKTPSPTLHLPRVGLVSRVRKLKPAAELLEESQRYRSGQSIYATRILQKYLPKDESKSDLQKTSHNKENVSGSYVHAIVQRLSRETTPVGSGKSSKTNSNGSLHWTESPRAQSEFVSHIVRKLSSSSGPDSQPLIDRTNEDKSSSKITKEFNGQAEHPGSEPEVGTEDSPVRHRGPLAGVATSSQHRNSCEVAEVMSSTASPMTESSLTGPSSISADSVAGGGDREYFSDTATTPTDHTSMSTLPAPGRRALSASSVDDLDKGDRALMYGVSGQERHGPSDEEGIEVVESSRIKQPSSSEPVKKKGEKTKAKSRRFPSSLSPIRRGAEKGSMETVGVLCKQSISFDLGVSLHAREEAKSLDVETSKSRKPRSWDPSESAAHEIAVAITAATTASSPTTTTAAMGASASIEGAEGGGVTESSSTPSSPTSKEKKRPRRFLDANWLQRSKRFFKVNK